MSGFDLAARWLIITISGIILLALALVAVSMLTGLY